MNDKLKNLEKKKLIQEYNYTKSELLYRKSIIEENAKEFMDLAYKALGKEREVNVSEESNIEANNRREEEKFREEEIDPYIKEKAKKLYREISKRTHPDKDPEGIYSNTFKEVAEIYNEGRLFDLYSYCDKLGIEYEIEDSDIELIKIEIEENKKEIQISEKTFVYLWSIQKDEKAKSAFINLFVKTMKDKM